MRPVRVHIKPPQRHFNEDDRVRLIRNTCDNIIATGDVPLVPLGSIGTVVHIARPGDDWDNSDHGEDYGSLYSMYGADLTETDQNFYCVSYTDIEYTQWWTGARCLEPVE